MIVVIVYGHHKASIRIPGSSQHRSLEVFRHLGNQGFAGAIFPVAAEQGATSVPGVGFASVDNRSNGRIILAIERAQVAGHVIHRGAG